MRYCSQIEVLRSRTYMRSCEWIFRSGTRTAWLTGHGMPECRASGVSCAVSISRTEHTRGPRSKACDLERWYSGHALSVTP